MQEHPYYYGDTLSATDDLGRSLPLDAPRRDRQVGLFYFLWLGSHGTSEVHDNSKILARDPGAPISKKRWEAAGGRIENGAMHWWGEPLFHYYSAEDMWVVRKHVRMFLQMGIDFLMIDATNNNYYPPASLALFSVLDEFWRDGWQVPRVGYYTYTKTGETIQAIYEGIYKAHPEYSHLWYTREGKPFIVGDLRDESISPEAREFFQIDDAYMNSETYRTYHPDGTITFSMQGNRRIFPWIDFADTPTVIFNEDGSPKMMTISPAEICETLNSTYPYLWDTRDRTRSWDGKRNRQWLPGEQDAWKYGYNFGRQIEAALREDPPLVFVCGWNEWVAGNWASYRGWAKDNALGRYTQDPGDMCMFVDQFNINMNRDLEPMRGGYGDSYFLQLASFVRRYKGANDLPPAGGRRTIDLDGGFDQWRDVPAVYRHPVCSAEPRDASLYEHWKNLDPEAQKSAPADQLIREARVCRDEDAWYFYAKTVRPLHDLDKGGRMTLLIQTGGAPGWYGYDLIIRRRGTPDMEKAAVEKSLGGWNWETVGEVEQRVRDCEMMLKVPARLLGEASSLSFKWADNWREGRDIWTFYLDGDCAPYGRMNYVCSER